MSRRGQTKQKVAQHADSGGSIRSCAKGAGHTPLPPASVHLVSPLSLTLGGHENLYLLKLCALSGALGLTFKEILRP
jgi:hypothetical protein